METLLILVALINKTLPNDFKSLGETIALSTDAVFNNSLPHYRLAEVERGGPGAENTRKEIEKQYEEEY